MNSLLHKRTTDRLKKLNEAPPIYGTVYRAPFSTSDKVHFCIHHGYKQFSGYKTCNWLTGISTIIDVKRRYPDIQIFDVSDVNWQWLCIRPTDPIFYLKHGGKVIPKIKPPQT